ncbi:T9SS type A sorting domain-containing protein [bacterium]|nr:T9SS type A sorting domain-containing protein [bacterium]
MKKIIIFVMLLSVICMPLAKTPGDSINYEDRMMELFNEAPNADQVKIGKAAQREFHTDLRKVNIAGADMYKASQSNMSILIPSDPSSAGFYSQVRVPGTTLSFIPMGLKIGNSRAAGDLPQMKMPRIDKTKASFDGLFPGISEEFIVDSNKLKHNIYLDPSLLSQGGDFSYTWAIPSARGLNVSAGGVTIRERANYAGDLIFGRGERSQFKVERPFAYIEGTEEAKVYGEYEISIGEDEILLTMHLDLSEFADSSERIIVDPTVIGLSYQESWPMSNRNLVSDSRGNLYYTYYNYDVTYEVYVQRSTDGGLSWETPVRLSYSNYYCYSPAIAVDDNDLVYVAWMNWDRYEIEMSRSEDLGLSWTTPIEITNTGEYGLNDDILALAADGDGLVYLAFFSDYPSADSYTDLVFQYSSDKGENWDWKIMQWEGPDAELNNESIDFVSLEIAPDGTVGVLGSAYYINGPGTVRYCRIGYWGSADHGQTFSEVSYLENHSSSFEKCHSLSLSYDTSSQPHILYMFRSNTLWSDSVIRNIYRYFNGVEWTPRRIINLDPDSSVDEGIIALDNFDNVYIAWTDNDNDLYLQKKIQGAWQAPFNITDITDPKNTWWEGYPDMPTYFDLDKAYGGPYMVFYDYLNDPRDETGSTDDYQTFVYLGASEALPTTPEVIFPTAGGFSNGFYMWNEIRDRSDIFYKVQIADDADFTSLVFNEFPIYVNELIYDSLSEGSSYYLRVKALDRTGYPSEWSSTVNFTYDSADPVSTLSTSEADTATGWWNIEHPLSITLKAADDTGASGVKDICYWTDADTFTKVPFNWVDIQSPGNAFYFSMGEDDTNLFYKPMGFLFPLYDGIYSRITIDTNGWVSFEYTGNDYSMDIPSTSYDKTILPYMDDQMVSYNGWCTIYTAVVEEPRRYVVTYWDWSYYWMLDYKLKYQAVLYENGRIDINIMQGSSHIDSGLTIGVNGGDGNDVLIYKNESYTGVTQPLSLTHTPPRYSSAVAITDDTDLLFNYASLDNANNFEPQVEQTFLMMDYETTRTTADIAHAEQQVNQSTIDVVGSVTDNKSGADDVQYFIAQSTAGWLGVDDLAAGNWAVEITLVEGDNDISFRGIDVAGNVEVPTMTYRVVYNESAAYSVIYQPDNEQHLQAAVFPYMAAGPYYDGTVNTVEEIEFGVWTDSIPVTWTAATAFAAGKWHYDWDFPGEGTFYIASRALDITNGWTQTSTYPITVIVGGEPPLSGIDSHTEGEWLTIDPATTAVTFTGTAKDLSSDIASVSLGIKRLGADDYTWYLCEGTTIWSYSWQLPVDEQAPYYLLSRATDLYDNVETNTLPLSVKVDTTEPYGAITTPTANSNIPSVSVDILGWAEDDYSGVYEIMVYAKQDTTTTFFSDTPASSDWTLSFTFPDTGTYQMWWTIEDNVGNIFNGETFTVTVTDGKPASYIAAPIDDLRIIDEGFMISGTALDFAAGPGLTKVEIGISSQGDTPTWYEADGTDNWTYFWTDYDNGAYTVQSRAISDSFVESPSPGVDVYVNCSIPPSGLVLKGYDRAVQASWDKGSSQNIKGYAVYKRTDATGFALAGTTSNTELLDLDVDEMVTYYYVVSTIGEDEQPGPFSSEKSITVNGYGSTVEDVIALPNPCLVDGENDQIRFINLSENTKIEIYSITGDLVFSIDTEDSAYSWDLRNSGSRIVTTGIYVAVFISEGETAFRKVAVIR